MLNFEERGKLENPGEKPLEQGKNQQQTQPTYSIAFGFEPVPYWWEASALTTAPPLLPNAS